MLTDKADVNLPADNTIRYQGTVNFIAGNGAPLPSSTSLNVTDVRCPISLTLDTKFGKLVSNAAVCTDDKGGTLDFSLRDLYIKDSRIFGNLGNEALAAVNGFPLGGDLRTTARVVTVTPTSSKIGGAIYGKNAKYLVIHGSGALGGFNISAMRQ